MSHQYTIGYEPVLKWCIYLNGKYWLTGCESNEEAKSYLPKLYQESQKGVE